MESAWNVGDASACGFPRHFKIRLNSELPTLAVPPSKTLPFEC